MCVNICFHLSWVYTQQWNNWVSFIPKVLFTVSCRFTSKSVSLIQTPLHHKLQTNISTCLPSFSPGYSVDSFKDNTSQTELTILSECFHSLNYLCLFMPPDTLSCFTCLLLSRYSYSVHTIFCQLISMCSSCLSSQFPTSSALVQQFPPRLQRFRCFFSWL